MRILYLSGYTQPSHHRKVEILANAPGLEILHVVQSGNGKASGLYPSADGQREYRVQVVPVRSIGRLGDPHRTIHWPPKFEMAQFKPHLIHCEHEQESLMAAEVALTRTISAPHAPLILYAWQNIQRRRKLAVRLVSQFTLHSAQHIICANQEGVHVLQCQGYRGGTSVMPLFGLDTRYVYRRSSPELRKKLHLTGFVVGFVGRLVPEKGVDLLLHAVAQIPDWIHILVIGDGPAKAALETLATQLGLGEQCHFVGGVAYDRVPDYISLMDLLVLPSRTTPQWKEQFGRVMVEAMACQVAVVGSDSGAIPEVIGEAGLVFPEGDVAALAAIIHRHSSQPDLCTAIGRQGYLRAVELFSVERLASQILDIWHRLSESGRQ
ncbi:MAG: glycosyltransferase [Chloroflexi bacterium]|nr:glycosyltransferase [Chloroflexota bacterium]